MQSSEALARARKAFEAGDYRSARTLAARVECDAEQVADAQRILAATSVDRVQLGVLLGCLLLVLAVCYHYLL